MHNIYKIIINVTIYLNSSIIFKFFLKILLIYFYNFILYFNLKIYLKIIKILLITLFHIYKFGFDYSTDEINPTLFISQPKSKTLVLWPSWQNFFLKKMNFFFITKNINNNFFIITITIFRICFIYIPNDNFSI